MENLPPRPWSELATKDDLDPMKADIGVLRADVGSLRTDVLPRRAGLLVARGRVVSRAAANRELVMELLGA